MLSRKDIERAFDAYPDIELDKVGDWTLLKEQIIAYYMKSYSIILRNQMRDENTRQFEHYYIDGFSSSGIHIDRNTQEKKPGSAYNAAKTSPPFDHCVYFDIDETRLKFLQTLLNDEQHCEFQIADCNKALPGYFENMFGWKKFRRALCFLDPKGLDVHWTTVMAAGYAGRDHNGTGSVECFINYPQHDIRRNIMRSCRAAIETHNKIRMDAFWGDESWQDIIFTKKPNLFNEETDNRIGQASTILVERYKQRLRRIAGYEFIKGPFPFQNTRGIDMFYLLFASHNATASRIVDTAFTKFRG